MANTSSLKNGARKVAAMLDVAAARAERPSVDVRLANVLALRRDRALRAQRARRMGAVAFACVLAAMAFAIYWRRGPSAIAFSVDGARAGVGAWVSAGSEDVSIAFSEGSRLNLHPSGRARVVSVGEHGAQVLLERGSLSAAVVHRDSNAWSVVAGPFEVHVVGTRFDATWDPSAEVLTVALTEGHVDVTGTCLREAHAVRTGESVRLSCRDVVAIGSQSPPGDSGVVDSTAGSPTPSGIASNKSDADASHHLESPTSWRELSRKGDYPGAFAAADRQGIDSLIASASVTELSELSDVARLAQRPDVARRIYLALRDRFAGSDAAANAAFQLGRGGVGGQAEAQKWLEVYLSERPSGPFETEALGRLLELQHHGGQVDAARATAAKYLARHPEGAHAPLARSILEP